MATHCSILALTVPWTEEPGGLQFMGLQRVRHGWATNTITTKQIIVLFWISASTYLSTVTQDLGQGGRRLAFQLALSLTKWACPWLRWGPGFAYLSNEKSEPSDSVGCTLFEILFFCTLILVYFSLFCYQSTHLIFIFQRVYSFNHFQKYCQKPIWTTVTKVS